MSELEIQRRQEYKRNRKKWAIIQIIAIAILASVMLSSFLVYTILDKTYYVEYKENSYIDYMVQYKENDFFEDEWIEQDKSYISSLVNGISTDFNYLMDMGSAEIDFNYKYNVTAELIISNSSTGKPYYALEEKILPDTNKIAKNASSINIKENVFIDYAKYDKIARDFTEEYDKDASGTLIVTLNVDVLSSAKQFEANNSYSSSLNIPLAVDNFSVFSTSSSPENDVKQLAYKGAANRLAFLIIGIVAASLTALGVIGLFIFLHISKNEDITYAAKIRKILNSYGSFIQRMEGEFDCEGYQIVMIKAFTDLLGIRDTIQSPVLMSENKDETMTRFLIPTNTKILYMFEIKVDNYDEIYNKVEEEPVEEEPVIEEPVILENVDEEELAEAMEQPDIDLAEIEFVPDDDDQFEVPPEQSGIEVIGVVWPERKKSNKVYRYDPNGEILEEGDLVLVPTRDVSTGKDVIRKVAVAHGNHFVDPEHIKHPLKKIIAVIKRHTAIALTPNATKEMKKLVEEEKEPVTK